VVPVSERYVGRCCFMPPRFPLGPRISTRKPPRVYGIGRTSAHPGLDNPFPIPARHDLPALPPYPRPLAEQASASALVDEAMAADLVGSISS
jgi:hypothetical protein